MESMLLNYLPLRIVDHIVEYTILHNIYGFITTKEEFYIIHPDNVRNVTQVYPRKCCDLKLSSILHILWLLRVPQPMEIIDPSNEIMRYFTRTNVDPPENFKQMVCYGRWLAYMRTHKRSVICQKIKNQLEIKGRMLYNINLLHNIVGYVTVTGDFYIGLKDKSYKPCDELMWDEILYILWSIKAPVPIYIAKTPIDVMKEFIYYTGISLVDTWCRERIRFYYFWMVQIYNDGYDRDIICGTIRKILTITGKVRFKEALMLKKYWKQWS